MAGCPNRERHSASGCDRVCLSQVAGAHFLDLAGSLCCIKAWQSAAAVMQRIAMPLEILGVLVTWFCHRQALWLERGLRRGTAQHSLARHSTAPHSNARRNAAKHKQLGETRHSTTRHSTAHHSTSHHILGHFGPTSARMESHTTAPHSGQCERRTGRCAKALTWRYLQGLGEVGWWRGALSAERHLYRGLIWSQGASHIAIVSQSCLSPPPFKGC